MTARAFATMVKGGMRVVASVIVAAALVMPAFPLSQLTPAYADTVGAAERQTTSADTVDTADQQAVASSAEYTSSQLSQINVKVPINGVTVDADGQVVDAPLPSDAFIREDAKLQTEEEITAGEIANNADEAEVRALAAQATANGAQPYAYLSDLSIITTDNWSYNGWSGHGIQHDKNQEGQPLSLIVDGEKREYSKGVSVHAKGQVTYDISALSTQYPRFTAKLGVDASRGTAGSIKCTISASNDGETWDVLFTSANLTGSMEAIDVDVSIAGRTYLRIYVDPLGNNSSDHGTVANAKLVTSDYVPVDFNYERIHKLDYYDAILSAHDVEYNYQNNYQLVLERALVNKLGYWNIQNLLEMNPEYKEMVDWIFDNQRIAEYALEVGDISNGVSFLKTLYGIYDAHKEDFAREDGYVFEKMMIALAAARTTDLMFPGFLYAGKVADYDPLERYELFKKLYDEDELKFYRNNSSFDRNNKEQFKGYHIALMRLIMNIGATNDELLWLSDWVGNKGHADYYGLGFMRYNLGYLNNKLPQEKYFDEANREIFTKAYNLNAFNVPYGDKPNLRHWMMANYGGVCGNISKMGVINNEIRGVPGIIAYQPGHVAYIRYEQDADGNGVWKLENAYTNWGMSATSWYGGNHCRTIFGWDWKSFCRKAIAFNDTGNNVAYTYLAQANLNNYPAFKQSYYYNLIANSYTDKDQKLSTYNKALAVNDLNLDSWEAVVNSYKADSANKTSADWRDLCIRIIDAYTYYPMAMDDLIRAIKPYLNEVDQTYVLSEEHVALKAASAATKSDVLQYDVCIQVANTLLKASPNDMASFSFDGENAGKIKFNSPYDEIGFTWRYSLDGGASKSEEFREKNITLTDEQMATLTEKNGIQIYIQGLSESKPAYTIPLVETKLPDELYANDLENRVVGVNTKFEWRNSADQRWTSYAKASPNNTGNKTLEVRVAGTGNHLPSESKTFQFTADNQPKDRKYVAVSHLKVESFSSEEVSYLNPLTGDRYLGSVSHAIDANINTSWYNCGFTKTDTSPYITLRLDKPRYISAIEIVPGIISYIFPETDSDGNPWPEGYEDYVGKQMTTDGRLKSATVEGSTDGKSWHPLLDGEIAFAEGEDIHKIEIPEQYRQEDGGEISYIRIKANPSDPTPYNYCFVKMINVYQDLRNARPTAGIVYSPSECTNQDVIARLDNISADNYEITSEGGENHVFTENGEWEFTFTDLDNGKTGSEKAVVNWIDKIPPNAELTYNMDEATGRMVVQVVNPSEEITFAEGDGTYEYVANGDYEILFYDKAGNEGRLVAHVNTFGEMEAPDEPDPEVTVYPLTLDIGGGAWVQGYTAPTEYDNTQAFTLPGDGNLSRPGYMFAGWFAKDESGNLVGEAMTEIAAGSTGAMELCAKWSPIRYSITYNLGGDGTSSPAGIDLSGFSSYSTGDAFTLPGASIMKWEGHTFAGWYESSDFSGSELREIPAGHYGDVELYAKWTGEACVVNYHENGGKFESDPQLVYGFDDGFSVGQMVDLPSDILRQGYEFAGWYEDEDFSGLAVSDIGLFVGTVELFAKWTPVEYAIIYVTNGGSWVDDFHVPASSYTIESEDILLPDASGIAREGYKFKGWFTNEGFAGEAEIAIVGGSTGDKTFYAKWEKIDEPDVPDEPTLEIISIAFAEMEGISPSWDEGDYARIEIPRSKAPSVPEDFDIEVQEGITCTISKHEPVAVFWLLDLLRSARAGDSESTLWDIVLQSVANPDNMRSYLLEVVPIDDDPSDSGDDSNTGDNDGNGGNGDNGGNGNDSGDTGNGSGVIGGDNTGNGGAGDGGGSADRDISKVSGDPNGSSRTLAGTGDDAPLVLMALFGSIALFALVVALRNMRRDA